MRPTVYSLTLVGMLLVLSSCATETTHTDPYLDHMQDTSYANRRDKIYQTADRSDLSLADFAGDSDAHALLTGGAAPVLV